MFRLLSVFFVLQFAACGGGGGGSSPPAVIQNNPAPSTPGNFQASVTGVQTGLNWDASTDDQSVVSYNINRNNYLIGNVSGLSFTDSQMLRGVTYYYRVAALDNQSKESIPSLRLGVTAILADQSVLNCASRQCFFVSATGVDDTASNDGTVNFPFKTIKFALARTNPGGIVYIRGGDYNEPTVYCRAKFNSRIYTI